MMKLYDNDAYREEFMALVYELLDSDGTNDRANQIIDAFDSAPEVETEPVQPNAPLTLDELREMEGEPVFLKRPGYCDRWALVKVSTETLNVYFILVDGIEDETFISAEIEIKNGCKVYRRKPEERAK